MSIWFHLIILYRLFFVFRLFFSVLCLVSAYLMDWLSAGLTACSVELPAWWSGLADGVADEVMKWTVWWTL